MKLYIAEKPSLGRAIADALPKPHKKHQGYIEVGNGDVVTWCIGHILEQAEPDSYDEKFKKWQLEHLPIIPQQWQLKPKYKTKNQLAVIRKLVKQCQQIVHAGDPDREGQLLIDEVIDFLNVAQRKRDAMQRLLVSDLNLPAVKRALTQLKSNKQFVPLSVSALARSRADWLYGINLTRAYTIQGGKVGYKGVLSVGRVQTPILGLVVTRDKEIKHFVSKPFYEVNAHVQAPNNQRFIAKWQPSDACSAYMDDEGRVLSKALAENVVARITNQAAKIADIKKQQKKLNAPLPYNLSSLQIDAAKRFSLNAKLVLDVCQSLYEKHKLITYPRSDCRYLPNEQFALAKSIINTLSNAQMPFSEDAKKADASIKSKAWNNAKVGAHHAIIPTEKSPANSSLSSLEKNVYGLIVRQYLAQFYPAFIYQHTHIELTIAGGKFNATANVTKQLGWKKLFEKGPAANTNTGEQNSFETDTGKQSNNEGAFAQVLSNLKKTDLLHCEKGELLEKLTQPPKHFTDATLLAAMTGINRFVKDATLKSILKDTDGLGTEATRAGIIELLFKRGFLQRQGKAIVATPAGVGLIEALPEICTTPDMTAKWEATLNSIAEQQANYKSFMQPLESTLNSLISAASSSLPTSLKGVKAAGKPAYKKRKRTKKAEVGSKNRGQAK
ncbi:DNA topoisomerase III [Alteromonas sp. RW2A1]|uniref:DNA topoisomerase III n=1 Tax=Alteromonas sp. RW2A1 TaxID=1917158 RepID=UPI00090374D5|nr:DNA topoisomerase III [Alteromonas sp. RW2A1]APE05525.1 DNA topoisomerase III [Alteromonas sp. RW2A1]